MGKGPADAHNQWIAGISGGSFDPSKSAPPSPPRDAESGSAGAIAPEQFAADLSQGDVLIAKADTNSFPHKRPSGSAPVTRDEFRKFTAEQAQLWKKEARGAAARDAQGRLTQALAAYMTAIEIVRLDFNGRASEDMKTKQREKAETEESIKSAIEVALIVLTPEIELTVDLAKSYFSKAAQAAIKDITEKEAEQFFSVKTAHKALEFFANKTLKNNIEFKIDTDDLTKMVDNYAGYLRVHAGKHEEELYEMIKADGPLEQSLAFVAGCHTKSDTYVTSIHNLFNDFYYRLVPILQEVGHGQQDDNTHKWERKIFRIVNSGRKDFFAEVLVVTTTPPYGPKTVHYKRERDVPVSQEAEIASAPTLDNRVLEADKNINLWKLNDFK